MKLAETFSDPSSRVQKTLLVIDMNESTSMKERGSEAQWITTYGWFYDAVAQIVRDEGGQIVKYIGDGALAVFSEDEAVRAINAAIKLQEYIADQNERKVVSFTCSVAVAYGEAVQFEVAAGATDYLGLTVDRAFRLCGAANSKAIFADAETVSAASMNKVRSSIGVALKRKVADYQGPAEKIVLDGFSAPVAYHEIWWSTDRYGVSPKFLTKGASVATARRPVGTAATGAAVVTASPVIKQPGAAVAWLRGSVKRWPLGAEFGFLMSGEEDFFCPRAALIIGGHEPHEGAKVIFVALDSLAPGKSRRAANVFVVGAKTKATVTWMDSRGFGFAEVSDAAGEAHRLFIRPRDAIGLQAGDRVQCGIAEEEKGPIACDIEKITE